MSSIIRWDQILYFNHKNQKKNSSLFLYLMKNVSYKKKILQYLKIFWIKRIFKYFFYFCLISHTKFLKE